MSKMKTGWWSKVLSFCFIVFFMMALGIGFSGIREARTNTGINLALDGAPVSPQALDQEVPAIEGNNVHSSKASMRQLSTFLGVNRLRLNNWPKLTLPLKLFQIRIETG